MALLNFMLYTIFQAVLIGGQRQHPIRSSSFGGSEVHYLAGNDALKMGRDDAVDTAVEWTRRSGLARVVPLPLACGD